eukprot:912848-Rhodomonas_salina.4
MYADAGDLDWILMLLPGPGKRTSSWLCTAATASRCQWLQSSWDRDQECPCLFNGGGQLVAPSLNAGGQLESSPSDVEPAG